MRIRFPPGDRHRATISIGGTVLLLAGWVAYRHWELPGPEEALREVRLHLERRVSQRHLQELQSRNLTVPDRDMARRWERELREIADLEIEAVSVTRPLPAYLTVRRSYTVQAVIRAPVGAEETRYFHFGSAGGSSEHSRQRWWFPF